MITPVNLLGKNAIRASLRILSIRVIRTCRTSYWQIKAASGARPVSKTMAGCRRNVSNIQATWCFSWQTKYRPHDIRMSFSGPSPMHGTEKDG